MHWIALVDHPEHVCCRYRLAAFRPFLEQAGYTLELMTIPCHWWSRIGLFRRLHGANIIVQRRLFAGWQRTLLRRAARRVLFDFDDAVFLRDSYAARGLHDHRRLRRFAGMVGCADAVIAGNAFLAEQAARWIDERSIQVIPTCVDPKRYPLAQAVRSGDGVELVWVGSSSTLQGLQAIAPLLEDIGRNVSGVSLKLLCDRFLSLRHLPVRPVPWTETNEAAEIAGADIGISWLPDDAWSRGKCGLKVLQYMAAGLPVIANPVGVQMEMVRHGETGFLVQTPAQWIEAVRRLAKDVKLRRRMGRAGRRLVEERYSVAAGAARWVKLLERLREPLAA
ncbi:MAG TPA: glycosyltransferase family 4 protein [Gemmataceae bacterium]|jgi:glycosyltransferase involved in cell wall biosynthesis